MDEPMENPGFDKEDELDEFMDDNEDVLDEDEDEEWLMAPVTPPRATVTVSSTYEVGGLSMATMSNLEYRHEELVKKMVRVSDAEVADSIIIREIHPPVATVEKQVYVMASQTVQVVSRLEEIETRVQQVESRVDTYPSGQMALPGQDVIVRLSQQVQTLQTTLHEAKLQNQELRTRVAEMKSREGILMSYMLWMEECLTVLEKRLSGQPSGTQ
uniref:Uncharacterized protein n=1 Tax=Tanacetum cinerariifolium TaxID=118510 RepID=A0A699JD10_TANCI|nr:hypothetical protein [Tanacetum cinerariifolium]